MTTPLIIEDLNGNMFAVQTLVQEKEVLNNEKEIEFLLIENDETESFIEEIQTGYKAHFRNNIYWIYNPVYEVVDDKVFVQCKAIHEFFPYFNGFYTQETWKDQSMTPADSILPLFDGKRFTVNMQSSLYAAVMNNERNVTYTERIMYALGRHDGEYQIDGTNFNIKHRMGTYRDDIILHPDINITDIKKEVESEGLSTWGKGFWQKKKDDEGSETEEYEKSTTAVHTFLSSIYGTEAKEGKAIYNDSVKYKSTMKELIIAALDETFTLKYTMSIKEYDDAELFRSIQLGDTLNAVIEKLDADIDLRVLEINRDWLNEEMKDMTITIGNGGAKAEYSSTSVDVLLEDVMLGKRPLPPSAYDEGVRRATALINGDLNGNFQYMPDGVYGQDPDNPNHRTRYSIAGLAYMTDGRQWNNALTFRGLTASAIYTGTLRADLIEILGANGNYRATGGVSTWTDPNDKDKFVRIDPQGGVNVEGGKLRVGRDDGGYPTMIQGRNTVGERLQGMNPAFMQTGPVEITGQRYSTTSNELVTVDAYYFDQFYRDIRIRFAFRNNSETEPYTVEYGASGFGSMTALNEIETIEVPPNETVYPSLDFHLGVPDGIQKQFYIKFASKTSGRNALMSIAYVKNLDLSKYDHL